MAAPRLARSSAWALPFRSHSVDIPLPEHHVEPLGERGASEQPAEHRQEAYDPWNLLVEDECYRQLAMLNDAPAEPRPEPLGEAEAAAGGGGGAAAGCGGAA